MARSDAEITLTPTLAAATRDLARADRLDKRHQGHLDLQLWSSETNLWLVVGWRQPESVALRVVHAPAGLVLEDWQATAEGWRAQLHSSLGVMTVEIACEGDVVGYRTTLVPSAWVKFPYWPRDVYPLGDDGHPHTARGTVHFHQRGPRTGLVYGQLETSPPIAFLYHQDLTALNDYCGTAGASVADTVGGEWPELGFSLPAGDSSLPPGKAIVISSAHMAFTDAVDEDQGTARIFLDLLSQTYLRIERPESAYRDWPGTVARSLDDLNRDQCWSEAGGHRYLNAYYADESNPPESMVQLAVLLPLMEYSDWTGTELPITKELRAGLDGFWDDRIGALGRWHRDKVDQLEGDEPHKHPRVMDSWYLYHPLLNLSRLALRGDDEARELFLDSLGYVIEVAHRFEYRWPVFYDMDSLEVIKAESAPGKGGENDVGGFHAHVMLQAWDLTGEDKYLEEARRAADSLEGLGFDLAYQMNNTIFAAAALNQLAHITGEDRYLALSELCLANAFSNLFLWECEYGNAAHYPTFFGVFPLTDAPYTAAYEEVEAIGALDRYLRDSGDSLPGPLRILLPEMIRYLLNRGLHYFPPMLPANVIAPQPATGEIDQEVWLPLEDLYEGDNPAGQVGQEIYGAGEPFGMIVRHYWPVPKWKLMVYCDYPIDEFAVVADTVGFRILGDERFACEVRLIPKDDTKVPPATIEPTAADPDPGSITPEGHRRYSVHAGQRVQIRVSTDQR